MSTPTAASRRTRSGRKVTTGPRKATDPTRFVKLGPKGEELAADAKDWDAVLDNTTGLTWSRRLLPCGAVSYAKAIAQASKTKLCGFKDWRAPTRAERLTIVDDTRLSPAIDTAYFDSPPSGWEWTSTAYAGSPGGCAWVVIFGSGYAAWYYRHSEGFVRAVRPSQ